MKLLIDGGWLIFKSAFPADGRTYRVDDQAFEYKKKAIEYCETFEIPLNEITLEYIPKPEEHAFHNTKLLLNALLKYASSEFGENVSYEIFIKTDLDNFRTDICASYKAHRSGIRRPYHEEAVRKYLLDNYNCAVVTWIEEDDALGIAQCQASSPTCIVSHDKDLKMIPGNHIHCHKKGNFERLYVDEETAWDNFYTQCITGDVADNIPGLYKITGKRVTKAILLGLDNAEDKWSYIRSLYGSGNFLTLLEIAETLWILRE